MQKLEMLNKIIWVTGASSGIGKELTQQLLARGSVVIASSRNLAPLHELKNKFPSNLELLEVDVTQPLSLVNCMQQIQNTHGRIDIAILNAGNCTYIDIHNFNVADIEKNFAVNFFGLANCIEACLPLLRKSKQPHLVGMTSAAALLALPRAEGYGSAKAAASYLLQTLQTHLYQQDIYVSIIYPGFVKTPLTDVNDFAMPFLVPVDLAAKYIINGIRARKRSITFPVRLIWLLKFIAILPDRLRIYLLAKTVKNI